MAWSSFSIPTLEASQMSPSSSDSTQSSAPTSTPVFTPNTSFYDVPPELFAHIFELGIHAFGLDFIPPVALVCKLWANLVRNTPRLWGIMDANRLRRGDIFQRQMEKCKNAPLQVHLITRGTKAPEFMIATLASVANRWETAEVSTNHLSLARWEDMRGTLRELALYPHPEFEGPAAEDYFEERHVPSQPPALRVFDAYGLRGKWVMGFLSRSITSFRLSRLTSNRYLPKIDTILSYLALVPNVVHLYLETIHIEGEEATATKPVYLPRLMNLTITHVRNYSRLMLHFRAPALQALVLTDELFKYGRSEPLSPVFSLWSQEGFLPKQLHTLELHDVLADGDASYLIRWLARLPHLVRLTISDQDMLSKLAGAEDFMGFESSLFRVLASPNGAGEAVGGGWLLPSLMQLRLLGDTDVDDLIPLARVRGGGASEPSKSSPARLRLIETLLCTSGPSDRIEEATKLVDEVHCVCLGCCFDAFEQREREAKRLKEEEGEET